MSFAPDEQIFLLIRFSFCELLLWLRKMMRCQGFYFGDPQLIMPVFGIFNCKERIAICQALTRSQFIVFPFLVCLPLILGVFMNEFILPELYCPFPSRINKYAEILEDYSLEWVLRFNLLANESSYRRFCKSKFLC